MKPLNLEKLDPSTGIFAEARQTLLLLKSQLIIKAEDILTLKQIIEEGLQTGVLEGSVAVDDPSLVSLNLGFDYEIVFERPRSMQCTLHTPNQPQVTLVAGTSHIAGSRNAIDWISNRLETLITEGGKGLPELLDELINPDINEDPETRHAKIQRVITIVRSVAKEVGWSPHRGEVELYWYTEKGRCGIRVNKENSEIQIISLDKKLITIDLQGLHGSIGDVTEALSTISTAEVFLESGEG